MIQPKLTPREKEVLALLKEGLTNEQIGAQLNISKHTARHYVEKLLDKFRLRNRIQFVKPGIIRATKEPKE